MDISDLSPDQQEAWALLQGSENVFITGEAGSGKSHIIRRFMRDLNPKTFPVLASTGAAAVLVGGRTFHSFMGLGIMEGGVEATIERALNDRRVRKRLNEIEGFVVDEVSMLSGPTFYAAEQICQRARETYAPWGGLRVVAVGDFAQLPPVQNHRGPRAWAFLDSAWSRTGFQTVILRQNMRTASSGFLNLLNDVRRGAVTPQVENFLNTKVDLQSEDFIGTRLFPRRDQTDAFNTREIAKLPTELKTFTTVYSGRAQFIEQLKKNSPLPDELHLKVGALVMLRQNDPKQRWVNGSTGYIRDIQSDKISIELLSGKKVSVERVSFSMLNAEGEPVAAATNFPLSLAYATTIHKAQGMTLDRMVVDLSALWEPGHAYVALSRIIDPTNLSVLSWQPRSVLADPVVTDFYQSLDR